MYSEKYQKVPEIFMFRAVCFIFKYTVIYLNINITFKFHLLVTVIHCNTV